MHGEIKLTWRICWQILIVCRFIKDILNMCMKMFATGKKIFFGKMTATLTSSFISIHMFVCLYWFSQSHTTWSKYAILIHFFSIPTRQSLSCGWYLVRPAYWHLLNIVKNKKNAAHVGKQKLTLKMPITTAADIFIFIFFLKKINPDISWESTIQMKYQAIFYEK